MKPLSKYQILTKAAVCFGLIWLCGVSSSTAQEKVDSVEQTILIFGDSLTAGYGVDYDQAYPSILQSLLKADGLSFKVMPSGVSGETTAGGLRRVDWVMRKPVDIFVLALGGNDGLRGIDTKTTQANLQAIIDKAKAKYPTIRIVIAGMQMPPNMGEEYTERFQNIFLEIAKANKAALIPFLLEGIGADPRYNQPDLIHPTPEGHKIVAATVWKTLGPILTGDGKSDASE